jgi:hypothetical protein
LPTRQTDFLFTGAALICGCFFASQSVIYRGIYLLLALPGLAELSRRQQTPLRRRLFASAGAAIVFVLWTPFLDQCLKFVGLTGPVAYIGLARRTALLNHYDNYDNFPGFTLGYVLWLAGELAWWWIITLLLAVLGAFVARTELWALFCRFVGRPSLAHPTLNSDFSINPINPHQQHLLGVPATTDRALSERRKSAPRRTSAP